jgi:lysophospholipase L1-like esterase
MLGIIARCLSDDNIHLAPEGNKLIARRLAPYIEQELDKQYTKTIKE